MADIITKLQKVKQTKEAIKTAIQNKGGNIDDTTPFNQYAEAIDNIIVGGGEEDFTALLLTGNATSFEIPSNITSLAPYRFNSFTNLKTIDFKRVKIVPKYTCAECSNLESVTFANGTTEIGDYAFNNCKKLVPSIPRNLTKIGDYAFYYAGNSKSSSPFEVVLDNNCEVGSNAFYYTYLSKIDGNFTKIGGSAFKSSSSYKTLTNVNINSCTYLDSYCFRDNYFVENFYINPESIVSYLGSYAFRNFGARRTNTDYFVFDFNNSTFNQVNEYAFAGESSYKNKNMRVYLPSTVTTISSNAFAYNENLELFLNSMPSLSSTNSFSSNTNLKIFAKLDDVGELKTKTNWLTYATNINGYGRGVNYGVGKTLPLYTDAGGFAITWYEDKDFTIPVTNFNITEENVNNNFYAQVGSTREVGWVKKITTMDANIVISDGVNVYEKGDYIPVGTTVTITASPTDSTKQTLFMFQINGADSQNGASVTVEGDVEILALYYDGVNYPFLPTLADNTYQMIAQCCRLGLNKTVWTLGDTFPLTLTNGDTVTIRYCDDTSGRYSYTDGSGGTNAVFEIVELIRLNSSTTSFMWDAGNENDWQASDIRSRMNTGDIWNLIPEEFKTILKPVNILTAKNGNNGTLVTTSDYLFLPAERELFSTKQYSRQEEWNALGSQFTLYAKNNTNDFRKKYKFGTTENYYWWGRSPYSGYTNYVCNVGSSGSADYYDAGSNGGVSPCFAL